MKKKSFKALSLILTAVMVLSSVNPAAVAVAAPVDSAYTEQDVDVENITEEETSEAVTEEATTEAVATEVTTEEVSEATTEEVAEAVTEDVTEATTQAEVSTEEATEVGTTEATSEQVEAEDVEVEEEQKRTITNGSALLSTQITDAALLNLVATALSKTAATATVNDLMNYTGDLVLTSSSVTNIKGLGLAQKASSIDISGLSKVTAIPNNEFQGCSFVTFKMSQNITSIGQMAFYECANMTTITTGTSTNALPGQLNSVGQKAFAGCAKLTTITIPYLQDEGAVGMFQFCSNLTKVTFGAKVTKIPVAMFLSAGTNSDGMTVSFTGATSLDKILGSAFHSVKFAEGTTIDLSKCTKMTGIDSSAFRYSKNLKTVILPKTLTSLQIGSYAFADTTISAMYPSGSVKSEIFMPNYITSLGEAAFYNCKSITAVTLSSKLTAISDYTFDCCQSLAQVKFNNNTSAVTWIGDAAFRRTAITSTDFMNSMPKLVQIGRQLHDTYDNGDEPFEVERLPYGGENSDEYKDFNVENANQKLLDDKPVGSEVFSECSKLTTITIPDTVKIIANRAFYFTGSEYPSKVASVIWVSTDAPVAGTVRRIYSEAFVGNNVMTSVALPENKGESLQIGLLAFARCQKLATVGIFNTSNNTLPNTVSSIGAAAFFACVSLPEIHIQAYNGKEPILETRVFESCEGLTKATLPTQTTKIPFNFFAGCPMTSFNFTQLTNLVEIGEMAFMGNQFAEIDFSNSPNLQKLKACCISYLDVVDKTEYMTELYDVYQYTVEPAKGTTPKLKKVILPEKQPNGMEFATGLFAGQLLFTTLYKKGATVTNQVVIPAYVLPDDGGIEGLFFMSGVSKVVWEADTSATATANRWKEVGPFMYLGCPNIKDAKDVLPKYVVNIHRSVFSLSAITSADLSGFTDLANVGEGYATTDGVLYGVFAECPKLTTVKFPSTTTSEDGIALKEETFKKSPLLESVDLGAVSSLGMDAFTGCIALESIDLKNVKVVGQSAFVECTALSTVKFGSVETIDNYAFQKCSKLVLTNTPLPDTLKSIGSYAFNEATSLGKVQFGSGLETIRSSAFDKAGVTSVDFTRAAALTTIEMYAFRESALQTFDISGTRVEVIPQYMLFDCAKLTKATFGQEIVYISENAIAGCPKFKTLSFYTTATVDRGIFSSKGSVTEMYTGQMNTGVKQNNISIEVLANTPEQVIVPLDRELDFPYYVNEKGTSNIEYICIVDNNAKTDLTVENHMYVSAKTNNGYYKGQNSNGENNKYMVSGDYYDPLTAAPTTTVEANGKTVDVIRVTGLKESGSRDLHFKIYAGIDFTIDDYWSEEEVTYNSTPFEADYKVVIQDPQTQVVLYEDSEHNLLIPSTSNIQATTTNMCVGYYYDLVDKIETGAKQDNYNIVIESSDPNVLAVGNTSYYDDAAGTCETNLTYMDNYYKSFYLFPKGVGTATISIYPARYDASEREKHKTVYTFNVNSDIQSFTLEVPEAYYSEAHPGSAFNVFKEYTNYFGQVCNQNNLADFRRLTNSKIIFTSSDPDYVSVDQVGNVKVLKVDPTPKQVEIAATYTAGTNGENVYSTTTTITAKYPDVETNKTLKDTKTGSKYSVTTVSTTDLEGEVTYEGPINKKSKTVVIPDTITINGVRYKVTAIKDKAFKKNKKVKTVKIGKYVKTIGNEAFSSCTALTKVTIGNGVESIGDKAFYKCKKLKTVSISYKKSKLTTIGSSAFYGCTALTKITLPKKLTSIYDKAFYGCKKLKTITIKSSKLSYVGTDALKGIYKKATIKVPKKQLKYYKTLFEGKGQKSSVKIKKG